MMKLLFPFLPIYLFKARFSLYSLTRARYCIRLTAEAALRLQLSSVKPAFKEICQFVK